MLFTPVTAAGACLAHELVGAPSSAPVRVYLAGLGSAGTVAFAAAVADPRLASAGQHLLVDLVGTGWSDPDDSFSFTIDDHAGTVIRLLDSLGLESVELIGHSLGGSTAISIAAQRPDLIGRLVVIEPNLDPGVGSTSVAIAAQSESEFVRAGYDALVSELRRQGDAGDAGTAEWARTIRRWSPHALHRSAVSLLADRPATFRAQLAAFGGRRLYVSGELSHEDLAPLREAGCEVRVVSGAGHDVMFDNPDGFVRALL